MHETAAAFATCPFCGLLCDDVTLDAGASAIAVRDNGCARSRDAYAAAGAAADPPPRIGGAAATLEAALDAAAAILRGAAQPLVGGLATDVAGARAAVALADRCGATIDHVNASAKFRNLLAIQDRGIISTTLAEVRNRADLVVVIGPGVEQRFPRLFERVLRPGETLFGASPPQRSVIRIGADSRAKSGAEPAATLSIPAPPETLHDVLAALSATVAGRRLERSAAFDLDAAALARAAKLMAAARYGVVTWAAPDFDVAHAELAVQAIVRLLAELNRSTRFAALPLGGSDGDFTADAVALWQTGFPFRTSFATGAPRYDPLLNDGRRMLEHGEADALLWLSTLGARPAPSTAIPTIVLASPSQLADGAADAARAVAIPVGVPGIDHPSHLLRVDKVVTLRLAACRPSSRPRAAEVLDAIRARL